MPVGQVYASTYRQQQLLLLLPRLALQDRFSQQILVTKRQQAECRLSNGGGSGPQQWRLDTREWHFLV